jgi:tripartite-type tricarboxylate transporter receptor subunit TctC
MRRYFACVLAAASVLALAAPVIAQDLIEKPVKIIVGFPAGGTADIMGARSPTR